MRFMLKPLSWIWLKLNGWEAHIEDPSVMKCVVVAAPHTSNWDMPYTMTVGIMLDLDINWLGKHTLFKPPWRGFMRFLGGIPVDRRQSGNYVEALAHEFSKRDKMRLVLAPEGTRGRTEFWRSGFYHIAKAADVPIVAGYMDYKGKRGGLGKVIYPIGTKKEVMDQLREAYEGVEGFNNDWFGPVKLRDEDETPVPTSSVPVEIEPPSVEADANA